jgi:hypothetical protein
VVFAQRLGAVINSPTAKSVASARLWHSSRWDRRNETEHARCHQHSRDDRYEERSKDRAGQHSDDDRRGHKHGEATRTWRGKSAADARGQSSDIRCRA